MVMRALFAVSALLVSQSALADEPFPPTPADLHQVSSEYGLQAVRVVLTARLCMLTKALQLSRNDPSGDYESPDTYSRLISSTKSAMSELRLSPLLCHSKLVKGATPCMPFLVGGLINVRLSCGVGLMQTVVLVDQAIPPMWVSTDSSR